MPDLTLLWRAPELNPINGKARSIPLLNPLNPHGRVLFFSWFGFFIAFWSWYAFPPLLKEVIADDIGLSQAQIGNSNIIALVATLVVRVVAGPACDRFGPRYTFAACLLIGAIPTFLSGTAFNAQELYALRFFIGILGGSFVPCQVWTTGFFDKNCLGTANALTAGLGNAGGGVTYFLMPAIYESLVSNGLSSSTAWRVAYVVPGILIVFTGVSMVVLCPDTPTGKWSERGQATEKALRQESVTGTIVDVPGRLTETNTNEETLAAPSTDKEKEKQRSATSPPPSRAPDIECAAPAQSEVVESPTLKEFLKIAISPQTLVMCATYFCSFGAELSINSILGSYIGSNFPDMNLQTSGNWAAMFGLLNAVFRPLGGVVSDYAYRSVDSTWGKKAVLHGYGVVFGAFLIALGRTDPTHLGTFVGLMNIGAAFFLEGANGLNYALVPHVHPHANGIVSGFTGASGNFGGVIFAIIFRVNGSDYGRAIWIIGIICLVINASTAWIKPIPKGQFGGR